MKIHKLDIENIASLKGHHVIDFDAFQTEQGSFAITGDTGSGKSTILNCISLALYGKSYKGLTQGDFVTLGEAYGKVELTFSCAGSMYQSIWGCRVRKKNGEYLKAPSHTKEFFLLNGTDKKPLDAAPEDVIHLSFEQFCKTVILNQGEFARFLTSTFRERKDILEKLYHGEKLDGFNPLLRQKISVFAQEQEQLLAQMQGLGEGILDGYTEAGLEQMSHELEKRKARFQKMETIGEKLKDLNEVLQKQEESRLKLAQLDLKIQDLVKEHNEAVQRKSNFDQELEKFLKKQRRLAPALHQATQMKKAMETAKTRLEQAQRTRQKAELEHKQLSNTRDGLGQVILKIGNDLRACENELGGQLLSEEQLYSLAKIFDQVKSLTAQIGNADNIAIHLKKSLAAQTQEHNQISDQRKELRQKIAQISAKQDQNSSDELEKKLFAYQALEANLDSFQKEANRLTRELSQSQEHLEERRKNVAELSSRREKILKEIEIQKDAIKACHLDSAKFTCLEQSLKNAVCIVCGSDSVEHLSLSDFDSLQEKTQLYQKNLQQLQESSESAFKDLERARTSQSALQAGIAQIKERIETLKGDFLASNIETLNDKGLSKETLMSTEMNGQISSQRQLIQEKLKELKDLQFELRSSIDKEYSLASAAEKTTDAIAALEADLKVQGDSAASLRKEVDILRAQAKELATLEDLEKASQFIELQQKRIKIIRLQNEKQKDDAHLTEKMRSLDSRLSETLTDIKSLTEEIDSLMQKIKSASPDLDPFTALEALEKEADVYEVKRKNLEEELKTIEIEKSALYSRKQTLEEQLKDTQNLSFTVWGMLKEESLDASLLEPDCLNKDFIALLEGFTRHATLPMNENLSLALELSRSELSHHKELLEQTKLAHAEYKTILARQNSAKDKIKALRKEYEKTKGQKEQWEELHLIVGKDEFRNYILAMVEKLLIQQTNAELGKLCDGRYLIQHKQSSSRLAPDFYIIDKFRGDEARKVSTLSGGETFLVSLAMAMALAELTRGNADLDSFFIDEGFGTLDRDSLEEALDMLQDIQTRGKQIGLISHVKELTQRIPVNIHLQKNRLGNSSIEIVYN